MGPVIHELENPDGREPWGKTAPDDVAEHGPTDRALRWTAHFYRYGYAVSYNPTKEVEEMLSCPGQLRVGGSQHRARRATWGLLRVWGRQAGNGQHREASRRAVAGTVP